jgi:hypothetical protein
MLDRLLRKLEKGDKRRRCMTCKYWSPVTEDSGRCMKTKKNPIFKLANYVCSGWEFWKAT